MTRVLINIINQSKYKYIYCNNFIIEETFNTEKQECSAKGYASECKQNLPRQ